MSARDIEGLVADLHSLADALPKGIKQDFVDWPVVSRTYREAATELLALKAENDGLRAALENLMPFVRAEYIECHGFKCRHPTCGSCHGDSETDAAEARGIAADQDARAILRGSREAG